MLRRYLRQLERQHRLPVMCGHIDACIMIGIMAHIIEAMLMLLNIESLVRSEQVAAGFTPAHG